MRNGWSGTALAMPGGVFGIVLFVTCGTVVACGGSSKSKGAPSSGAGRGGSSAGSGGAAGSGAAGSGGAAGGGSPSGGAGAGGVTSDAGSAAGGSESEAAGVGGDSSGGASAAAGAAGDDASHAGESAGGAGGGCQDWCTVDAPACCGEELRCVESAPSCRIDVLAESVDVIYEYTELQAEVNALSDAIAATIPLAEVEHAAVESPPAARFEMTLNADASAEFSALAGTYRHPFRVSCDEQELFVGVLYMVGGAAAIDTPVLHVEQSERGALVLRLGAWQGAWLISGTAGKEALRERIDRTELRAEFCARGILAELE